MRIFLTILFGLYLSTAEACECSFSNFTEKYQFADFVAIGKIIKVYPNETEEEIYRTDIQITSLIKGSMISSIHVLGRSDGKMGSSCSIFTPENQEYIFFGRKNDSGQIVFGACSGTRNLNSVVNNSSYILKALEVLKNEKEDFSGFPYVINWSTLSSTLEKFEGKPMTEKFALYEVRFHKNLKVKKVKVIKGFGEEVDSTIIKGLADSTWKNQYSDNKFKAPKGTKKLIGVYYYEAEANYPSFLSEFAL